MFFSLGAIEDAEDVPALLIHVPSKIPKCQLIARTGSIDVYDMLLLLLGILCGKHLAIVILSISFIFVSLRKFPVQIKRMVHRPRPLAQVEHRSKCARNIVLCSLHRGIQIISLGKIGSDSR